MVIPSFAVERLGVTSGYSRASGGVKLKVGAAGESDPVGSFYHGDPSLFFASIEESVG